MSMKPIKRAVATTGKYTARDGSEKNSYTRVGTLFKRDDGSVTLKLDAVPVGQGFAGWINFYDLEEKQQAQQAEDPDIPF